MEYIVGTSKPYLSKTLLKTKMTLREKKNNNNSNNRLIHKVAHKSFANKNNMGAKLLPGIILPTFIIKV